MLRIDKLFVTIGFLWLIAGAAFGTWLGASGHHNFANSHAHTGLLGFVASVLFGLVHRGWPELRSSRLALPQLAIYETGAAILILGKVMVDRTGQENVFLFVGSITVIIGAAMFLWLFWKGALATDTRSFAPAE
ncbi:MAG TPA: hypothetical protein VIN77_09590 [Aurantimonas sp.]|uniref:Cytochrome-c oxidase n=1 Tax=Aurantimonas marianensis TaxID=2920428 RepID=A0A9X2H7C8_9HYPH|nr:hypothetical protein [Aurantimonas marianensis]MCP3055108.1 hypothetical protein [Aurantimonas marianensis]